MIIIGMTAVIQRVARFVAMTWFSQSRSAAGRIICGAMGLYSSLRFSATSFSNLFPHATAQNSAVFALMCTYVHLRAPLCGKMKKSEMVHIPQITAHRNQLHQLAPTCIKLRKRLAEKKLRAELQPLGGWTTPNSFNRPIRTYPRYSDLRGATGTKKM